jgi:hypothetical protein
MARVVKAPGEFNQDSLGTHEMSIFLGGSIDMGAAEDWQTRLTNDLADYENVVLLNPRRNDWDSSWVQDPTPGTQFYEQVEWEMERQEDTDLLIYYFAPDSKSPITLLELGLYAADHVLVCCPKEFYRYGNVKMVCERYGVQIVESYEEMITDIRAILDVVLEGDYE